MSKILVKNGIVFDPINKIEGEVKDILIESGKIVESFSNQNDIKEINAKNKTVIPSALDIHSHIASQQINWVRLLGRKYKPFQKYWNNLSLENIVKEYISNGYTFILEANVYPSLSKQTIFNFKQLPVLDKAMLLNISNIWALELEYQREMVNEASTFLSDLLLKTKGFGFKVYNPFEAENWNFQKLRNDLTNKGRLFNFSPIDVYEKMARYNEALGMPHSVHVHIEGYEQDNAKENLKVILQKIKSLNLKPNPKNKLNIKRSQIFHLAHASSCNNDGDNSDLIKFYNENHEYDLDLGFLGFDPINPLTTSDRRLINFLYVAENPFKVICNAVESEGDTFSTLRTFDKQNETDCILWANAIDLALNIKNIWQMQLSVNFPNYSHIRKIPEIATLLLSSNARNKFLENMNKDFVRNNKILNNDKELTFNDFIILTRSSPARSLGIGSIKGNLGKNADGDLNILNINTNEIDTLKDFEKIKKSLESIEYVIKEGKIIKKDDSIDITSNGKIFWSSGTSEDKDKKLIMNRKKEFYQKYYSIFYDSLNISINNEFLRELN
ncbi:MAG: amidohydrolase family protein [Candidatus Hermodarchaeota archaeon]